MSWEKSIQNYLNYETITCNILTLEKHFGGISRKVEDAHIENCLSASGIITKSGKWHIGSVVGLAASGHKEAINTLSGPLRSFTPKGAMGLCHCTMS